MMSSSMSFQQLLGQSSSMVSSPQLASASSSHVDSPQGKTPLLSPSLHWHKHAPPSLAAPISEFKLYMKQRCATDDDIRGIMESNQVIRYNHLNHNSDDNGKKKSNSIDDRLLMKMNSYSSQMNHLVLLLNQVLPLPLIQMITFYQCNVYLFVLLYFPTIPNQSMTINVQQQRLS
jgi:hypothetical protein